MNEGPEMAAEESPADAAIKIHGASAAELKQVALSFLRLGTTAFGGPAAHIAMMEEEFVRRRGWVSTRISSTCSEHPTWFRVRVRRKWPFI